jgi:hypothetical protein
LRFDELATWRWASSSAECKLLLGAQQIYLATAAPLARPGAG